MGQVLAALAVLFFYAQVGFFKMPAIFFYYVGGKFCVSPGGFFLEKWEIFFIQAQFSRGLRGKVAAVGRGAVAVFLQNFFGVFLSSARVALGFHGKGGTVGRGAARRIFAARFKFFRGRKKFARWILRGFGADSRDNF